MTKVIAKTIEGQEFIYSASSAHRAPVKRIKEVCEMLNSARYKLKDGEKWFVYEVSEYDVAFDYSAFQAFGFRNGNLVERKQW